MLNDNGRSYAPTISKLSESLVRIRSNPVYMRRQERIEALAKKFPWLGEKLDRSINATKLAIRAMWEPPAFFENLGIRYMGPFDGHDVAALEKALRNASKFEGPVVVHVLTQKGRGYGPAENDPIKNMHDMGGMKAGSYTAAFCEAIVKLGEEHPELVAITAAMPDSTGLLPFMERFPNRCFDVGIAEQHAVTAAAGMAMGGLRPVVAIYSTFMTRAVDQVMYDVGLHKLPVVFCLDRAGITGDDGPSHHGVLDMVLFTKVPGMTVFAPSSYQELQVMLADAIELDGPAVIRWPKTAARTAHEWEVGHGLKARRLRKGSEICILSVGKMLDAAEQAATILEDEGVSVTLWDARVVAPLDQAMIDDAAAHRAVITVEDGLRAGGAGEAMRDAIEARHTGDVGVRDGHPDDVHRARQARRDPRRPGPRRRRHRRNRARDAARADLRSAVEGVFALRVVGRVDHLTHLGDGFEDHLLDALGQRQRAHRATLAAATHRDVDRVAVDAHQRGEATVGAERRD